MVSWEYPCTTPALSAKSFRTLNTIRSISAGLRMYVTLISRFLLGGEHPLETYRVTLSVNEAELALLTGVFPETPITLVRERKVNGATRPNIPPAEEKKLKPQPNAAPKGKRDTGVKRRFIDWCNQRRHAFTIKEAARAITAKKDTVSSICSDLTRTGWLRHVDSRTYRREPYTIPDDVQFGHGKAPATYAPGFEPK